MAYQNIIKFAANETVLSGLFGTQTTYNTNNQKDRNVLRAMIESSLSPENLSMDGELNPSQVKQKYEYLTQCLEELNALDAVA